jgi:hypothetical protein
MRVLIGCEESGVVSKAFRDKGHEAWSLDLESPRQGEMWHIQCDIIKHLEMVPDNYYDLIILHPDCTTMAVCSNKHYAAGKPEHWKRLRDVEWTLKLWELAKKKGKSVCLENPASVVFTALRKIGVKIIQYVHPWQHGHMEQKKTGLALCNLPELEETDNVYDEMMKLTPQEREKIFRMPPGPNRKRDRSVTYQGIADAMASQWGAL